MVARVKELVDEDPRVTTRYIAEVLNISSGSVCKILKHKQGYRKVCARWIPHILTPENKRVRVEYAEQLLQVYDECDSRRLDEIITGDETWVYYFELERKAQNKAWVPKGGSAPQIARRNRSAKKVLYTIFFNTKGVVLQKPGEQGKSITGRYYKERVLSELNHIDKRARPNTGMRGIKLLHHNAPAHKSKVVQEYLAEENIESLPHPPYSPDLAPCDFFLFPHLKKSLAGRHFYTRAALGTAIFQCFQHLSKEDYKGAFLCWIERLRKCVAAQGEYFEKLG